MPVIRETNSCLQTQTAINTSQNKPRSFYLWSRLTLSMSPPKSSLCKSGHVSTSYLCSQQQNLFVFFQSTCFDLSFQLCVCVLTSVFIQGNVSMWVTCPYRAICPLRQKCLWRVAWQNIWSLHNDTLDVSKLSDFLTLLSHDPEDLTVFKKFFSDECFIFYCHIIYPLLYLVLYCKKMLPYSLHDTLNSVNGQYNLFHVSFRCFSAFMQACQM